ncbi:MAG: bifunctional diguanylate cyclase/phosphodiesterase [Pelovirga sp.]
MHLLTNRLIVRYLLMLCATFGLFLILVFAIQTYAKSLEADINVTEMDFLQRIAQIKEVRSILYKIEISFHSIATSPIASAESREQIAAQVDGYIGNILLLHTLLADAQCLRGLDAKNRLLTDLPEQLFQLEPLLAQLIETVNLRDKLLTEEDQNLLLPVARKVRLITVQMPPLFAQMHTLVTTLVEQSEQELQNLSLINRNTKLRYFLIEIAIIAFCVALFVLFTVMIFRQLLALYTRLEKQLKTDPLTRLPNRYALTEQLLSCPCPLLGVIDIDSLRTINELYGADAGNEFLIQLAARLKEFAQEENLQLFRTSGDEFALLGSGVNSSADDFISKLLSILEETRRNGFTLAQINKSVKVTLTCGVCTEADSSFEKAEKALHRAKLDRLTLVIYDHSIDSSENLQENAHWIDQINAGLEKDAFIPLFQPIVNAQGYPVKFEALVRLKITNNQGLVEYIQPICFLNLAHRIKSYHHLSRMMLFKSLQHAKDHGLKISVNLSYQDLINQVLIEDLRQLIISLDIGYQLTFEIVETEDIKDYMLVKEFMDMFRSLGVKLSIDDFGSGFSNFHSISILRPDYIKIDGSLIKNLDRDFLSWTLVKSICVLARELHIQTIAEYVHSEEVFTKAKELGVDLFQGYYFSEPVADLLPLDQTLIPIKDSS